MSLARILARAALRHSGLRILLLPDEVPDRFLREVVEAVNQEVGAPSDLPRAVVLNDDDRYLDSTTGKAPGWVMRTRALPERRSGDLLAVAHENEFTGLLTLASTFRRLLQYGFPIGPENDEFLVAISEEIARDGDLPPDEALTLSTRSSLLCVAKIYKRESQGDVRWQANWWEHARLLVAGLAHSDNRTAAAPWAAASLPIPEDPVEGLDDKEIHGLVKVFDEHWATKEDAVLSMHALIGPAATEAEVQRALRGYDVFDASSDGSVLAMLAGASGCEPALTSRIWGGISSSDFLKFPVATNGDQPLSFEVHLAGGPLPSAATLGDVVVLPALGSTADRSWSVRVLTNAIDSSFGTVRVVSASSSLLVAPLHLSPGPNGLCFEGELSLSQDHSLPLKASIIVQAGNAECRRDIVFPARGRLTLIFGKAASAKLLSWCPGDPVLAQKAPARASLELVVVDGTEEEGELSLRSEDCAVQPTETEGGYASWLGLKANGNPTLYLGPTKVLEVSPSAPPRAISNPFIAAARNVEVTPSSEARRSTLWHLEDTVLDAIDAPRLLGHVVVTSIDKEPAVGFGAENGLWVRRGTIQRTPSGAPWQLPSSALLASPEWCALGDALRKVSAILNRPGSVPSQLSWEDLREDLVVEVSHAYQTLVSLADREGRATNRDGFWARFPASVVVVSVGSGHAVQAILLSPLHPVRLAWRWRVEQYLRSRSPSDGETEELLGLVDGADLPLVTAGMQSRSWLHSLPLDQGHEQVFVGWSGLVPGENPPALEHLDGRAFPSASRSGLNAAAIKSVMADFNRLHPESTCLSVELKNVGRAPRSREVDRAILEAARASFASGELQGLKVFDGLTRLGEPDPFHDERLDDTHAPVTWVRFDVNANPAMSRPVHLRIIEDSAVGIDVEASDETLPSSFLADPPLRRFLVRQPTEDSGVWARNTSVTGAWRPLVGSLMALESTCRAGRVAWVTRASPREAVGSVSAPAAWTVSSDAHSDPKTLNEVAGVDGAILWEWRPGFASRNGAGEALAIGEHPYVIVCRIPAPFRRGLEEHLRLIHDSASERDALDVVKSLATRGIGFNTLLAKGGHQATGAVGHFLAARLLDHWIGGGLDGLRLCLPFDAYSDANRTPIRFEVGQRSDSKRTVFRLKSDSRPD